MNKDNLIEIINDTLDKCENEYHWMIDNAKNIYYDNYDIKKNLIKRFTKANIKLIQKTTVEAIIENKDKIYAVLNFASAKHPGGGVLRGTVAQEEALARASSLYPVIKQCSEFYSGPPLSPYYSDRIIYSKPIYVFKDDYGQNIDPVECEVITCAAPNYSFDKIDVKKHREIMTMRFIKILKSAIANDQRNLLLGAWGCGVFKNPADINAQIFREVLDSFSTYFDDIIFAIPDSENYQTFKDNLFD
jgi:uncharacterized protein (TIGR02452 family)